MLWLCYQNVSQIKTWNVHMHCINIVNNFTYLFQKWAESDRAKFVSWPRLYVCKVNPESLLGDCSFCLLFHFCSAATIHSYIVKAQFLGEIMMCPLFDLKKANILNSNYFTGITKQFIQLIHIISFATYVHACVLLVWEVKTGEDGGNPPMIVGEHKTI